ncbi:MAG: hypothetical protein NZO16_00655 [Deltaproteobacteria bacterium]|nr:hypothetical protein [Deltaproteobacteria bacterium]
MMRFILLISTFLYFFADKSFLNTINDFQNKFAEMVGVQNFSKELGFNMISSKAFDVRSNLDQIFNQFDKLAGFDHLDFNSAFGATGSYDDVLRYSSKAISESLLKFLPDEVMVSLEKATDVFLESFGKVK